VAVNYMTIYAARIAYVFDRRYIISAIIGISSMMANIPNVVASEFVVGVCTHLTAEKKPIIETLDMVASMGATSFRDDAKWKFVEEKKGVLHIPPHWDVLVDEARKRGIQPLLILDYGNKNYDDGGKPRSSGGIEAFTRYAIFVANHFKGRVYHYEIWNEWSQGVGHTNPGTAEEYVRLVRNVYPAIKRVDHEIEVTVGAVSANGINEGFLDQIVDLGVLKSADSLSLHTYVFKRNGNPDDWVKWMQEIEAKLVTQLGKPQPFYITEMGWPTNTGSFGVSTKKQAEYLELLFKRARALPFIRGIWWYDFQNDGNDPYNRQHNFGLVRKDFSPKPSYRAFQEVAR
jgi:hypothetical protein